MKILQRLQWIGLIPLVYLGLTGCASEGVTRAMSGPPTVPKDIFPGNYWHYSMGTFQKKENFTNVERAQWNSSPRNQARNWGDIHPTTRAIPNLNILQSYFMFDIRWKLKDGREFILENIDVRTIANDYLRRNPIQLQWQKENRQRDKVGDGHATLTHEIKDDTVVLKWVVSINRTPVEKRLTPTGAATKWDIYDEEYPIAVIKGIPTEHIDFEIKYELVREYMSSLSNEPPKAQKDKFPGNYWLHSTGHSQRLENLENVEIAQSFFRVWQYDRNWLNIPPTHRAVANLKELEVYAPLSVRWKLKDGRTFILEDIDVRRYASNYLDKNPVLLQWQRENRPRHQIGDYEPLLAYEIKNDTVLLKWVVTINRSEVIQKEKELTVASKRDTYDEEYIFATIKGLPVDVVDFNKRTDYKPNLSK
jgi:hypothetical protein